jgi:hypothetical protein
VSTDASETRAAREFFVGSTIGLLIGLLVGLSVSDVVAAVISGLVALLAALLGFRSELHQQSTADNSAIHTGPSVWRASGFALIGSAALLIGLVIRTHNLLGRTPTELVDSWTKAGYSTEVARELVAYQMLGVTGERLHPSTQNRVATAAGSYLFSEEALSECSDLSASRYADARQRANAFVITGGKWKSVGNSVRDLEPSRQAEILEAAWTLACNR